MRQLTKDTTIEVEVYHIKSFQASNRAYEGHRPNGDVQLNKSVQKKIFRKGDWLIPMNQVANRFLMEVLEPQMEDSYFTWNFFDPILQQKEGYSSYVFEETAADYLAKNPNLKKQLEENNVQFNVLQQFDEFHVSMLTLKFINAKTRPSELKKHYLVRLLN